MKKLQQKSRNGVTTQSSREQSLITILGPTASGKSGLAMRVASHWQSEIICADSRTIYKTADIGTAKPSSEDQRRVPHHMVDVADPSDVFSAYNFASRAKTSLMEIWQRNHVALLVGGSGMYIDGLLFDYSFRSGGPDRVRAYADLSLDELLVEAQHLHGALPPVTDQRNRRRVEQFIARGPSPETPKDKPIYDGLIVGLNPGKEQLQQNIAQRTRMMLKLGLIEEVERIRSRYGQDSVILSSPGYKQVGAYLDGEILRSELEEQINQATWQLARKQLTWFRRNDRIDWFDDEAKAFAFITTYLAGRQVQ